MGEVLVNFMFNAHKPHPEHDARFIASMRRVTKKTRMWVAPRAWVISIGGVPNAMAYGPGIPGLCAVGVSRELVDMLTDEELDGVIAHEFGHIRCRDTGILAVIGLILSFIDRLRKLLTSPGSLIARSPALYVAGWAVYFIGRAAFYISRFSISQEREIAADALAASYIGNVRPLIGALTKLHAHAKSRAHVEDEKPLLHDLMVAHPGLEERVESLKSLMNTQKEVAS
jgi:heat shock protein HtpX